MSIYRDNDETWYEGLDSLCDLARRQPLGLLVDDRDGPPAVEEV
jgi:hypothetical protein